MRFRASVLCPCGWTSTAVANAEGPFESKSCPNCGRKPVFMDSLSISVVADRLLMRGAQEIHSGDFTVPIMFAAMAVETTLTRVFTKWRSIESGSMPPKDYEEKAWVKEYREGIGRGGFKNSANFVSKFLVGKTYNQFVIKQGGGLPTAGQVHAALFEKRNQVMHWGKVDYAEGDAAAGLVAAHKSIEALKAMDREKYQAKEKEWRESLKIPPAEEPAVG
jgi:hypothetical protein